MATSLAQATAAAIEVTLGGKVRRLRPLTDKDYGEFEAWIQARHIKLARDNLELVPVEMQRDFMAAALDQAGTMTVGSPRVTQLMTSIPGAIKLLYLCLRYDDPDIEETTVAKWMTTQSEIDKALEALEILEGLNTQPPPKKPKARRKRVSTKKARRKRK